MNILELFSTVTKKEFTEKEIIVENLLQKSLITIHQAAILLKTVEIQINTESLEMSSGAKIVGGSDFETTRMS